MKKQTKDSMIQTTTTLLTTIAPMGVSVITWSILNRYLTFALLKPHHKVMVYVAMMGINAAVSKPINAGIREMIAGYDNLVDSIFFSNN